MDQAKFDRIVEYIKSERRLGRMPIAVITDKQKFCDAPTIDNCLVHELKLFPAHKKIVVELYNYHEDSSISYRMISSKGFSKQWQGTLFKSGNRYEGLSIDGETYDVELLI